MEVTPGAAIFLKIAGVLIVIMNGKRTLSEPTGNDWLRGGLGFTAAFGIAVVFVITRHHPDVPVLPACAIGTLSSGMIDLFGAPPGTILTGDPLLIGLMGSIVTPVS